MPDINSVNSLLGSSNYQTGNTTGTSATGQTGMFTSLLTGLMSSSLGSITDFSGQSSSSSSDMSYLSGANGLLGMGSMFGTGNSSGSSSLMMMFLLLVLAQQNGNSDSSLLNLFTGNTASASTAASDHQHVYANAAYTAASSGQGIPTNSWLASNPSITSTVGSRSGGAYRAVINQFNVETNGRYTVGKQGIGDTYCNIFVWDVTKAMGAEVPHYINAQTGAPSVQGAEGAMETNANQVNDWLNTHGPAYGWTKVSAEEAQSYANAGMPAITSWKNPSGHGHLQVVSPSANGSYDPVRGVTIAQAGRQLKNYDYITSVYGANTLPEVEYFVHI